MTAAAVMGVVLAANAARVPCTLVNTYRSAQYLEYERRDEAEADYGNESRERVWLRLYNNTTCPLRIPARTPVIIRKKPNGTPTIDLRDGQEVAMDVWLTDPDARDMYVHPGGDVRSTTTLPAAQSVTFSVAANLLKRGPMVVTFDYEWDQRNGTVEHRLRLEPKDLPEDIATWLKGVKDPPERAYLSPSHPGRRLSGAPANPTPEPTPKP